MARPADPSRTVQAYMVLAMAQFRLRQVEAARSSMAAGNQILQARGTRFDVPDWHDLLSARLLSKEAQSLISEPAASTRQ